MPRDGNFISATNVGGRVGLENGTPKVSSTYSHTLASCTHDIGWMSIHLMVVGHVTGAPVTGCIYIYVGEPYRGKVCRVGEGTEGGREE